MQETSSRRRQGTSLGVTYRALWGRPPEVTLGRPQDVLFQRPKDVGRGRPQDVGRRRPLALHTGLYGDVHRTFFGDVLRTSSRRNFAEWVHLVSSVFFMHCKLKIQVFLKIRVLKNFANFCGKHLRWETICYFLKNRLQHKWFPVKPLRAPFPIEQLRWLLFKISKSNNLFKDVSAISPTHNQSLITCSSHSEKLIWKCIQSPTRCSDRRFLWQI